MHVIAYLLSNIVMVSALSLLSRQLQIGYHKAHELHAMLP